MANLLTALRLLLAIPVVWAILRPVAFPAGGLLLLIVLAIASDYADGRIARARGTDSPAGMLFDHSTDFIFVSSGLIAAASAGLLNPLLPLLVVLAFSQYVLDSYFLHRQKQLRMSFLGRWNGIFYFLPLLLIAFARLMPESEAFGLLIEAVAYMLCLSTILSVGDRALAPRSAKHSL